jgi:AraC-like DNA-binding protein
VADPNVATVYNRGQRYTRSPLAHDGDRGDWFAVTSELAREIATSAGDPVGDVPDRPFRVEFLPVSPALYATQRRAVQCIQNGAEPLQVEELVLAVISAAIRGVPGGAPARSDPDPTAHRDLAMRARAELATRLSEPLDLATLAGRLGVSPWHLCRVFKQQTGTTITAYRRDLRLRVALEHLDPSAPGISSVAHRFGFSSHSHFTAAFRRRFGFTPSEGRALAHG